MAQSSKIPDLTVEEYLFQEERGNVRHEYVNGQIFAMSGATEAHNMICGNLYALLHNHLKGSGCRPFMNDMKVRVELANSFYYPDIMVTCEPFEAKSIFKQAPVLIAEVLSPSTTHIDRREKFVAYRQLSHLRQYLIIHQFRYRIESYQKDAVDGQWEVSMFGKNDVLSLHVPPSRLDVPVAAIYEGIIQEPVVEEEQEDYEFSRLS